MSELDDAEKLDDAEEQKESDASPVGGFAFFLSLFLILPGSLVLFYLSLQQARETELQTALAFIGATMFGALFTQNFIKGHISVLIHEFKHALISNLVGNKYKGMRVDKNSGDFQYAYTKKTAHYNAFISLAPYIVPICTFVGFLLSIAIASGDSFVASLILGIAYGSDLTLNFRDISPIQTDLTDIRGGYRVGVMYVIGWNLFTAAFVLSLAFHGLSGIGMLLGSLAELFISLHLFVWGGQ